MIVLLVLVLSSSALMVIPEFCCAADCLVRNFVRWLFEF